MPLIINQQRVDSDSWQLVESEQQLGLTGDLLIDWPLWKANKAELKTRPGKLGVRIDGSVEVAELADDLADLALVALHIPSFADGRAFSQARVLRQRYGFKGQVRATGDVTWDRLRFMSRCGIDALEVAEERYSDAMLRVFNEISVCYQGAEDDSRPLYRQ